MKFTFLTMPAYGHLNPMLGVAKELVSRGHEVTVYNTKKFKDKIVHVGALYKEYPASAKDFDFRMLHTAIHIAQQSLCATEQMTDLLIKEINSEKPDCILHDSLSLWGKIIGLHTKIPSIALVPSMGINTPVILSHLGFFAADVGYILSHPIEFMQLIKKFRKQYLEKGFSPPLLTDLFSNTEKLNIVFTSREFQPSEEEFGKEFRFVGPVVYDRNDAVTVPDLQSDQKIIYVALGTVYNDNIEVYRSLIQALGQFKQQAYVSIGRYIKPSELGDIPPHIHISAYHPQLEILKNASLFISHAGMNSVNESLYFGVPLLMLPIIQEQRINADRVAELGAGIYYKKQPSDTDKLVESIRTLLADNKYKEAAEHIGKTLRAGGGAQKAADQIVDFLS